MLGFYLGTEATTTSLPQRKVHGLLPPAAEDMTVVLTDGDGEGSCTTPASWSIQEVLRPPASTTGWAASFLASMQQEL